MTPASDDWEARTRSAFAAQRVMAELGIALDALAPGRVEFSLGHDDRLTQHTGAMHAGILTTAMDSACGFAAYTLMPGDRTVLTVEFKVNFLRPARAEAYRVSGEVLKPGRTLTVAEGRATTPDGTLLAKMTATLIAVSAT